MTNFIELSARDILGAAVQWRAYITGPLGYDDDIMVQVGFDSGRGQVWLRGGDKFQEKVSYGEAVGMLSYIECFDPDEDWDAVCGRVWDKLKKAMARDERELRAGLRLMGSVIEYAPSFTSGVGKMFADRIKAARDEATNFMIEHHGWKAEPAPVVGR